ncbi:Protein of unknown function [Pyronema omphalodes CBS 100304]|uniref:Uncharacterized protein n=1 Tax=Pyronema omphalodes (strain CBS 100304) TaxID=1076935 RepID=U4KUN6_PYROM|nr:Protein of unknown function [Pyronema omphalodes CBS 100304]
MAPWPFFSLRIGDDRVIKAASSTAQTDGTMKNTAKVLESLLLTSNKLRQKAEIAVEGLESVPRTKAIEHALVTQTKVSR